MAERKARLEAKVVESIRAGRDELIALVQELVAYDTTARQPGDPPREEAELQAALAARLKGIGGEIDVWEPEPTGKGNRLVPDDLDFKGRPQLAARIPGTGGGRSLLLTGHIDVVPAGPREEWPVDPFEAEVRDGDLVGRGVADMKGGISALCFATEVLHRVGVRLRGDIVICTVTDEETSGAGSLAAVAHGVKADAGICAEASGFDAWVACRGTMMPVVIIPGRAGHAGMPHPHWRAGGAVNAIDKARLILDAAQGLRDEWQDRSDQKHPHLAPSHIIPTVIQGGVFPLTYAPSCKIVFDVQYLPSMVDASGTGQAVEQEIHDWINAAATADSWLCEHSLEWQNLGDTVAAEMPEDHELVTMTLAVGGEFGKVGRATGLNSWHDAAYFTSRGGTPTFSYGPHGLETAHSTNERVMVDELVEYCGIIGVTAMRFCGVDSG